MLKHIETWQFQNWAFALLAALVEKLVVCHEYFVSYLQNYTERLSRSHRTDHWSYDDHHMSSPGISCKAKIMSKENSLFDRRRDQGSTQVQI